MQVVAVQRIDVRAAAPVGADARAEAVVEIAGLRLDLVTGSAAGRPGRVAVEIVDLGQAGADAHLVNEGDRVGQRELDAASVAASAAAEEAASSAATTASEAAAATAAATAFGRRTGGRAASTLRSAALAEKLAAQLVDHRLRRPA